MIKSLLVFFSILVTSSIAIAGEFQENAMCVSENASASFPRISVQTDPGKPNRGILILYASDGWTQVYSGAIQHSAKQIRFNEDQKTIAATFEKSLYSAKISFNNDTYLCDERSFGN